jgi:hypothetical protein
LSKGDRVSWKSGRAAARGNVQRVITGRAKVGGRAVVGSKSDPRYVVKDEASGKTVVRRGQSLRKLKARAAPAKRAPAKRAAPSKRRAAATTKRAPARKRGAAAAAPKPKSRAAIPRFTFSRPSLRRPTLRRPTLRRPRLRRPSWKLVAAAVGVLVVAAGAYAYFAKAPERLADDYREDAGPAFEKVDESMYEVFSSFRSRYFRGLAIKELAAKRFEEDLSGLRRAYRHQYEADRASIARANKAIAEAEAAIEEAEPAMTEVDSWPLLGGRGELGDADEDASDSSEYLDQAREFMPQFRELIAYSKQTLAIEEEITNALLDESPGPDASLETFKAAVNGTLSRLGKAKANFKKLGKAPEVASAFNYATDEGLELTIDFYEKVDTAFDQLDPGLLDEANAQIKTDVRLYGLKLFEEFDELQTDSGLTDSLDDLEDAEDDLAERLGVDEGPESVVPPFIPTTKKKDREQKA